MFLSKLGDSFKFHVIGNFILIIFSMMMEFLVRDILLPWFEQLPKRQAHNTP